MKKSIFVLLGVLALGLNQSRGQFTVSNTNGDTSLGSFGGAMSSATPGRANLNDAFSFTSLFDTPQTITLTGNLPSAIKTSVHSLTIAPQSLVTIQGTGLSIFDFNGGGTFNVNNINAQGDVTVGINTTLAGQLFFSGSLSLATGSTVSSGLGLTGPSDVIASGSSTVSGRIRGTGSLSISGPGTLTITNNLNDYSGGTLIGNGVNGAVSIDSSLQLGTGGVTFNAGTLKTTQSGAVTISSAVQMAGQGTVNVANAGAITTLAGRIRNVGSLNITGPGTVILTNNLNDYSGGTVVGNGVNGTASIDSSLELGTGGVTFNAGALRTTSSVILAQAVNLSGQGTFDVTTGTTTLNGTISGLGSLTKTGAGTLTLGTSNLYGGDTIINGGALSINAANRLGSGTNLILNGGTLQTTSSMTLSQLVNLAGAGTIDVTTGGATTTLSGGFNSGTGSLAKSGTGTLKLTGSTLYSGDTQINGGILEFAPSSGVTYGGAIAGVGTLAKSAVNNLTLTGNLSGHTGASQINAGTLTIARVLDQSWSSAISGTGTLAKSGASNLTLSGDLSGHTGATQINAGTLTIAPSSTLTWSSAISGTGTLAKTGNNNLTLTGDISGHTGATQIGTASTLTIARITDQTWSSAISGTGTLAKSSASNLTLTGDISAHTGITQINNGTLTIARITSQSWSSAISGTGTLAKSGVSILTLTGDLSGHTGATQINAGTLTIAPTSDLTWSSAISGIGTFAKSGASNLTLNGNLTALTGTATISDGTLTLSGTAASSPGFSSITNNSALVFSSFGNYAGVISGTGSLTAQGTSLTLSNNNTYSGGTTIASGRSLFIGSVGGSTGAIAGDVVNNGRLYFDRSGDFTHAGNISGSGDLQYIGYGTGVMTLSGNNTYSGGTSLIPAPTSDAVLHLGSSGALGTTGTISLGGPTLRFSAANTTDYSARFSTAAGQKYNFDTNGQTVTMATALTSSNGILTKLGAGKLILAADNTYSGSTTVSGGTLQIGNGGPTGSVASTTIVNNGSVIFNRSNAASYSGVISGNGSVTQDGGGNLTLSGANTYTGPTTITSGILTLSGSAAFAPATIGITNNSALVFSNGGFYAGVISGSGTLTTQGTNSVTLSNNNTYTGMTTITSGSSLTIGSVGGSTGAIAGEIINNGSLLFDRSGNFEHSPNISGTGSLSFIGYGSGVFTLSGNNTYTGGTTTYFSTSSVLELGSSGALGTTGTISLNGPTVRFTAANTTDYSARFSTAAGQRFSLDTNGQTITLASSLASSGGILTKLGAGTLILMEDNTYSGGTIVNEGTLLIQNTTGSGTGVGNVTVNAGTVGGSGTILGNVVIGNGAGGSDSFLSPGNSPGTFTTAGSATLSSDAIFVFEINDLEADKLVANEITLDATAQFSFTNLGTSMGIELGMIFTVLDNTSGSAISGTFANLADGDTIESQEITYTASYFGGTGNDLIFTVTSIPEPGTCALLALGLGLLFFRSRRPRRIQ